MKTSCIFFLHGDVFALSTENMRENQTRTYLINTVKTHHLNVATGKINMAKNND